jgi:predicted transcriptional regulator
MNCFESQTDAPKLDRQHAVVVVKTMTARELRSKRVAAEISATILAANAKINRSRLSNIERGYIQTTEEELQQLNTVLEDLIKAKSVVDRVAASVGWPLGAHHDQ